MDESGATWNAFALGAGLDSSGNVVAAGLTALQDNVTISCGNNHTVFSPDGTMVLTRLFMKVRAAGPPYCEWQNAFLGDTDYNRAPQMAIDPTTDDFFACAQATGNFTEWLTNRTLGIPDPSNGFNWVGRFHGANGTLAWTKTLGTKDLQCKSLVVSSDGNTLYVGGDYPSDVPVKIDNFTLYASNDSTTWGENLGFLASFSATSGVVNWVSSTALINDSLPILNHVQSVTPLHGDSNTLAVAFSSEASGQTGGVASPGYNFSGCIFDGLAASVFLFDAATGACRDRISTAGGTPDFMQIASDPSGIYVLAQSQGGNFTLNGLEYGMPDGAGRRLIIMQVSG